MNLSSDLYVEFYHNVLKRNDSLVLYKFCEIIVKFQENLLENIDAIRKMKNDDLLNLVTNCYQLISDRLEITSEDFSSSDIHTLVRVYQQKWRLNNITSNEILYSLIKSLSRVIEISLYGYIQSYNKYITSETQEWYKKIEDDITIVGKVFEIGRAYSNIL